MAGRRTTRTFALALVPVALLGQCSPDGCAPSAPPEPAGNYPTGQCDNLTSGLPGLNSPEFVPASIRQIGTSAGGRPIYAEYWGDADAARVVLVIGQIHGNECAPSLVVEQVRQNPPSDYGIWLIPTLNPDGYAAYTRTNANGIDLNADGYNRSQPETEALLAFTSEVRPILSVHVHSPNAFAGWYGTSTYVAGNPDASGAPLSSEIARQVSTATGIGYSGAGSRSGTNWFLWQGQRAVWPSQESVLIELHATTDLEVPTANPRPASRSVETVRIEARAVLDALDALAARVP